MKMRDPIPRVLALSVPDPDTDCWVWISTHARHPRWRPIMKWDGKNVLVARLVLRWKLRRPLRPRLLAGHTCDNKNCVNPQHLQEITYTRNLQDAYARGRRAPKSFQE